MQMMVGMMGLIGIMVRVIISDDRYDGKDGGDDDGDNEDEDGVNMSVMETVVKMTTGMMQVMKGNDGFGWDDEGVWQR